MAIFPRKFFFRISKGWIDSIVVPPIQLPLIIICLFLISGFKRWLAVPSGLPLSHILLPNPPPLCSGFVQNSVATVIFICSLLTQFPTDPQKGFFFDCRVCFYSSYFHPSLLLFLIILLILSTDQCRASAKHGFVPFIWPTPLPASNVKGCPIGPARFFASAHFFSWPYLLVQIS